MFFVRLLEYMVREGAVRVVDAGGRARVIGDGSPPRCTVRLHDPLVGYAIVVNPPLRLAEAYMDGRLTIEDGDLRDFLDVMMSNYRHLERHPLMVLGSWLRGGARLGQYNPVRRARRNAAHHYDLSGQLYDLFLDRDRQYSCAYFRDPRDSLETAQDNKKRHIAAKLLLGRDGLKVLDIGSGWGGLGLYLARIAKAEVTGVTLSVEQHKVSETRARDEGLASRVRFHLRDYRQQTGTFDRIVSVGMFEHVGKRNYDEFFAKVSDLLAQDGVALLHTIGRLDRPAPVNPFIRKYIFPGGDLPALSELLPPIERAGLIVTDVEVLRLHYAETLKEWRRRFRANWDKVKALYDERFCRMWDLYLVGSEMSFSHQETAVFQIQLAKRQDAVPLTRDYVTDFDRGLPIASTIAAE
jgi:cyclopropane-fatty-acyl-phospholipid synthase